MVEITYNNSGYEANVTYRFGCNGLDHRHLMTDTDDDRKRFRTPFYSNILYSKA